MKFKKTILTLGTAAAIAAPIAAVVSCGTGSTEGWVTNKDGTYDVKQSFLDGGKAAHKNVYTSNDNETDMLTSLGFYPDYANQWANSSESNTNFLPNTLKTRLTPLVTAGKIKQGPYYGIPNINGSDLIKDDISTVLIDKSDEPDKTKFDGYSDALVYQNSFKGAVGTFNDEDFTGPDFNSFGLNVFGGFKGVADAIDTLYGRTDLGAKAEAINTKVQGNIKALSDSLNLKANKKKLLVLQASTDTEGNIIFDRLNTVMVYNDLYSTKDGRGLGFEYPTFPETVSKNLKGNPWKVTAINSTTLANDVKGLADEYIISFDSSDENFKKAMSEKGTNGGTIQTKFENSLIDSSKNPNAKIHVVDRDLWKRASWGIYGTNQLITDTFLKEFTEFNVTAPAFTPVDQIFPQVNTLKQLR